LNEIEKQPTGDVIVNAYRDLHHRALAAGRTGTAPGEHRVNLLGDTICLRRTGLRLGQGAVLLNEEYRFDEGNIGAAYDGDFGYVFLSHTSAYGSKFMGKERQTYNWCLRDFSRKDMGSVLYIRERIQSKAAVQSELLNLTETTHCER